MRETILDVDGMSCASCVRHVSHALTALAGVADVEVRLQEGEVRVKHDPGAASVERLVSAVEDAGYDARVRP